LHANFSRHARHPHRRAALSPLSLQCGDPVAAVKLSRQPTATESASNGEQRLSGLICRNQRCKRRLAALCDPSAERILPWCAHSPVMELPAAGLFLARQLAPKPPPFRAFSVANSPERARAAFFYFVFQAAHFACDGYRYAYCGGRTFERDLKLRSLHCELGGRQRYHRKHHHGTPLRTLWKGWL